MNNMIVKKVKQKQKNKNRDCWLQNRKREIKKLTIKER